MKPLCFVLMPFGVKTDKLGREIDFNAIYEVLIKKAIERCNMEPIRADEELLGGTIHKPMFERLVLCDYAIADLTSLNPNVFYELGLRHAIKEHTTIPIFAFDTDLPFDLKMQRTLPYKLDKKGKLLEVESTIDLLVKHLNQCKQDKSVDSPVYQLVEGWQVTHNLSHEKTDVFRKQAAYENDIKDELFKSRGQGKEAVVQIFQDLKPIKEKSVGVLVDLYLSLRAVKAWPEMIACYEEMDAPVKKLKMIREQLGFAYNRNGESEQAIKILQAVIDQFAFDPETNGILGRVYKDMYNKSKKANDRIKATGYLAKAIKSYREGFDADWRDAYPGVNLVTLLELKGDSAQLNEYLPVVEFAIKKKVDATEPDYWDKATQSELSVLKRNYEEATAYLTEALTLMPSSEIWMLETTLNNFGLILDARKENNTEDGELSNLIGEFQKYVNE